LSRLVASLAVLACCLASSAGAVFGGTPTDPRSAPWTAAVIQQLPSGHGFLCSGTIIDATHVVTAAHCVFDDKGARARPETLLVKAGTANGLSTGTADPEQERVASSVRVHPAYSFDLHAVADDVAVLELAKPLDLRGPYVRAASLPHPGRTFPSGKGSCSPASGPRRPA
jgi:secreted trypsin-like serine protease